MTCHAMIRPGPVAGWLSAMVLSLGFVSHAQAQSLARTVVTTQTQTFGPGHGLQRSHGTRTVTITRVSQTLAVREPAVLPGSVVPFALLPAVAGIRAVPVAPPTVYRVAGPRTAMHEADETRMRQINPGARVISPEDAELTRDTRRRYAMREPGSRRMATGPRVIVVFPD